MKRSAQGGMILGAVKALGKIIESCVLNSEL